MKRSLVVAILFCLVIQISEAQLWKQKRFEAFAGLGTTNFFGDVGGYSPDESVLGLRDISFSQTRVNFHTGVKYKILRDLNIRLGLTFGVLHATDENGSNEERGYEVSTSIFEPALVAEYYFIKSKLGESYLFNNSVSGDNGNFFSALEVFAFTGFGGLSYSVKPNEALTAEGQPSGGFTAVIPVGVGVNLLFKPEYNLGLELGGRYSFSDYLDGYCSQYSSSNDVYYFLNVTFTYKIRTNAKGWPSFLSKEKY